MVLQIFYAPPPSDMHTLRYAPPTDMYTPRHVPRSGLDDILKEIKEIKKGREDDLGDLLKEIKKGVAEREKKERTEEEAEQQR